MVEFDHLVVPLLHRMSHLEMLTLSLRVRFRNSFIDGTHLDNCILSKLPHLHTFTFDIATGQSMINAQFKPSPDDIRRTFIQRGLNVDCYIEYHHDNTGRCHVCSLPFTMEHIHYISHSFPGGMIMNVRVLILCDDEHSFEHDFFAQISRSFPVLSRLTIANRIEQKKKPSNQIVKSEELFSINEYANLIELNCAYVHIDYLEQFLSNLNTRLPGLSKLHVQYKHLVTVTENFTRNTTRINCAKVKHITFEDNVTTMPPRDCYFYFPSL